VFGSVFTSPSPNPARKATREVLRRARVGDLVRATGSRMDGGQVWLERLENLSRN
jgi:hypothetical protein